jgi:hypothetical protein
MSITIEEIYRLLPAIYRTRDAAIAESLTGLLTPEEQTKYIALREMMSSGGGLDETQQHDLAVLEEKRLRGPLKALLSVIVEQVAGLEENIEQLYDDQFIETCADWVVPYIGDLIGYRPLDQRLQNVLGSDRAEVANTIRFRRRKGTAAVLEELALDVTGWSAAVVEFFLRLATTQYMNHIRLDSAGTANLRQVDLLELIGTPFDRLPRTADVRRIASGRGKYNIPNIGIFLWRVNSYAMNDSLAYRVDARRYMFNPLGANTQLYHSGELNPDVTHLATLFEVPYPITRRNLRSNLAQVYGKSIAIFVGGHLVSVDEVEACNLSDTGADPETSSWAHSGQTKVAIDPILGRVVFPVDQTESVRVNFYYGALADIGGGPYERIETINLPPERKRTVPQDRQNLAQALNDLNGDGLITLQDNGMYAGVPHIQVAQNRMLEIQSANQHRAVLQLSSDMEVWGGDSGEVTLDGLLITGGRVIVPINAGGSPNRLQKLRLVHCTLVPGGKLTRNGSPGSLSVSLEVDAPDVEVEIEACILGSLRVSDGSSVTITNSIVDALGPKQVAFAAPDGSGTGGALTVNSCTLLGKVHTMLLTASDSIFHAALAEGDTWSAPVLVSRRQQGYLRYCYAPVSLHLPPRFQCAPQSANGANQRVPLFTSLRYGSPGYCQLHTGCPCEIRQGSADQSEMGVFHSLFAPQREAAFRTRLDEYLRFGLEAGLFYAS